MGRWGGHLAVGVGEVGDEVGGQAREDGQADLRRTALLSATPRSCPAALARGRVGSRRSRYGRTKFSCT